MAARVLLGLLDYQVIPGVVIDGVAIQQVWQDNRFRVEPLQYLLGGLPDFGVNEVNVDIPTSQSQRAGRVRHGAVGVERLALQAVCSAIVGFAVVEDRKSTR